jgi:predicted ABC-type ATPase
MLPPEIVLIAGPNGAGKSTLARYLLPEALPFLNADEIAKTLPDDTGNKEIESGRELLRRLNSLVAKRRSFAVETTLSSRSLAPKIVYLKELGYRFQLVFLCLPEPELAIERVASRVRRGGHDIPEEIPPPL